MNLLISKRLKPKISLTALTDELDKKTGFKDGEILEINQVARYFNYVNRTVLGLWVTTEGDILGLSPEKNSDAGDRRHR